MNKLNKIEIDAFTIACTRENLLDEYQKVASGSAIYPGQGTPLGLAYCGLKLNGEAGELAEHVGKAMRDDGLMSAQLINSDGTGGTSMGKLTPERRELILKEIGDCLWYLGALCRELGTTLSFVALMNLRKLYDRQERNALQGSGDER